MINSVRFLPRHLMHRSLNRSIERMPMGETGYPRDISRGGSTYKDATSIVATHPADTYAARVELNGDFSVSPPVIDAVAFQYESGLGTIPRFNEELGGLATRQLFLVAYYLRLASQITSSQR